MCTDTLNGPYTQDPIMAQRSAVVMIFTSQTTQDLQTVTQTSVTPIVLPMAMAMEAVARNQY